MNTIYKAVIIDDNQNTVISLENGLDWNALGIEVKGTARDGKSGQELIHRVNPDIIITDINMPYMDGFTMVASSHEYNPEKQILIVITGYDRFQYASSAIKLSALDYILKPIDDAQLESTLKNAVRKLRERHTSSIAKINNMRSHILLDLTSHREVPIWTYLQERAEPVRFASVILAAPHKAYSRVFLERLEYSNAVSKMKIISVVLDQKLVILCLSDQWDSNWEKELTSFRKALLDNEETGAVGAGNIGSTNDTLKKLMMSAYENLLQYARKSVNRGSGEGIMLSDLQSGAERCVDLAERGTRWEEIYEEFRVCTQGSVISLQIMSVIFATKEISVHKNWQSDLNSLAMETAGIVSLSMCAEWLRNFLGKVSEIRQNECGCSDLVTKALLNIRQHCMDNIRLEKVAAELYVSPNYLSSLISKETGKTFQQHIKEERMNLAKTMLDDSRMSIEEIAYAIGYENYISFYNAFKKHEKITPCEYRLRRQEKD